MAIALFLLWVFGAVIFCAFMAVVTSRVWTQKVGGLK